VHPLVRSALDFIRTHDLLTPGDRVGVAVSGGADSVALLRILLELRQELGIVLSALHFNHKLRGPESESDEQFVRDLAAQHDLEIVCQSRDVKTYAAEKKLSLEAGARELRYQFFERLLQDRQQDRIATAHTLDDQAETVLLRLIRGSGFRGLGGIRRRLQVEDLGGEVCGEIVRPLLNVRRATVRTYLGDISQAWREDATNTDAKFTRNRVRQLLLPLLEKEFNPAIPEKMAELAEIAQGEEDFWTGECSRLLGELVTTPAPDWAASFSHNPLPDANDDLSAASPSVFKRTERPGPMIVNLALDLTGLRKLPLGAQRRVVHALEAYGMPLEFRHIEEILRLAHDEAGVGRELPMPWGWKVRRTEDELHFLTPDLRVEERISANYEYELPVPGVVTVWETGSVIETDIVINGHERYNPNHLLKLTDRQRNLAVRNWRPGDRFWPSHTKEPKKVKELLQDRHVTGDQKKRWPVVVCGDEVVWVLGLGVRRDFQANGEKGVLIRETPIMESQGTD
jgi:tRNA(Ile)-lysidine synthase